MQDLGFSFRLRTSAIPSRKRGVDAIDGACIVNPEMLRFTQRLRRIEVSMKTAKFKVTKSSTVPTP
jgi:hypothetical protein